jgi:hypothetical protein
MEILRFEQVPEGAPKRKKSSRGFLALGLVAALFGISTAFASSTIQINGTNIVSLGQGVSLVTGCDTSITVSPHTTLVDVTGTLKFRVDYVDVLNIDSGITSPTSGLGCQDKDIEVKFYDNHTSAGSPTALTCTDLKYNKVVFQDSLVDATKYKCVTNAVYFRVGAVGYRILLNNLDPDLFDNITVVSTDLGLSGYPA